jgi:tRNA/rRNA methyltransferase
MTTRFILIDTSHAGNVGATARAMKVMGFDDMVLVNPRWTNVLRREETIQRSSGALDVLAKARIVDTLDEALDGLTHLCATAMTARDFGPPTRSPRAHFDMLLNAEHDMTISSRHLPENSQNIGFLFGSERYGMKNEDVYRCHVALQIPTNPQFGSLTLGAAVQLIAYEWRMALGGFDVPADGWQALGANLPDANTAQFGKKVEKRADARAVSGMLAHLEEALVHIEYLDPAAPKKLMPRLNALFNRADLREEEIHILRGVANAMLKSTRASPPARKP